MMILNVYYLYCLLKYLKPPDEKAIYQQTAYSDLVIRSFTPICKITGYGSQKAGQFRCLCSLT